MFLQEHLAVYINNQLQTEVGKKAMEQLRLQVLGLKVFKCTLIIYFVSQIYRMYFLKDMK